MKFSTILISAALITSSMITFAADEKERKKDGEALGWLIVVDENQIDLAKTAKTKKLDPAVIEYADLMIDESTKNLEQTNALSQKLSIPSAKNKDATKLEEKGQEKLKDMSKEDDKKFQKEYIKTMVKGHKDVLDELNDKIEDVSADLKDHFKETKTKVESHLEKAKDLEKKMDTKG